MADDLQADEQRFLEALFQQTDGKTTTKISMYDIGAAIGLDHAEASRTAQNLMGLGLVEVKSLSGGIAISEEGRKWVAGLTGSGQTGGAVTLGSDPMLDNARIQLVTDLISQIKAASPSLQLPFDALSSLMADIKTMDAQLQSPRPKTAVFKVALDSIADMLPPPAQSLKERLIQASAG